MHTNEETIGHKECSDGSVIIASSNQLADLMANHATESVRLDKQDRDWLVQRKRQLRELCVFLGRLAHAAKNHALPNGRMVRDSEGIRRTRSKLKPIDLKSWSMWPQVTFSPYSLWLKKFCFRSESLPIHPLGITYDLLFWL